MPGETSNNQSNFNKHKVSLYAHLYEKYVEIKNVDGTVEITPDKYTWYNGGVVLEYVDCRPQPTCTGKRILLKQDMASLWDDVLRMNQTAGGTWTQEMAIQVESQLLLAMPTKIDLDPGSTLQGMKKYDPASGPVVHVHRELKTRKRKLNSYELEQEAAKKAKKEQMMFMMDERHGREFKPTFKLLPYFKSNRNKISTVGKGKQRVDIETAEQGRSSSASAKKSGRKLVRQLKFERTYTEAGDKDKVYKLFTLLNIYEANGKHEAIFHSLYEKDLRTEGKYNTFMQMMEEGKEYKLDDSRASYRNELGNAEGYKSFIKSFVVLYSIDNNLKYDSGVDKVPVEMLTEVTTELTSPQTEMKFDKMKPYEIIELLAQQSDAEKTTSSNEGAKDLSVADLYNAAAKKAMQAKPSVSVPVNQDSSLMPPPQRPPARRNSRNGNSRARQTATTQAQIQTPVQSQNIGNSQMSPQFLMHRTGNQTPVQQQIPQTQMQQPQVMAASQSPNQRPMQSPALIQQNVPIQVPQSSTDGIHPVPQQISIPTITRQVPIQQGVPALMQRQLAAQSNIQGIPNVRPMSRIIQNLPVNQNIAQGTTIQDIVASPSMLNNTRQKPITVRRTTQGQSQQMNVPVQQTAQMNIPVQTNSSQMNQVHLTPQINIPTQQTDRVTSQLNVQSQMNQAQQAAQINIPAQISDQVNIQQTQTTPRIPGRVTPRMSAQTQMNQAQSTPQINIPAQISDQVQATPRINPAQVPQVNATDQMNVQISQMRMNPQRLNAINQVNQGRPISIQQYQQYQLQLLMANQNMQNIRFSQPITYTNAMAAQQLANNGYIRTPMNMQQSFMPSGQNMMMQSSFPMQNQLLPGQPSGISGIRPQIPMRQFLRPMLMQRQNPMISQHINQQLQNQWIFQPNQNQLPQQPQNQNWSGDGNASGKQ